MFLESFQFNINALYRTQLGNSSQAEGEELKMQANENLGLDFSAIRDPYSSFHSLGTKYLDLKYSKEAKLSNSQFTQLKK